MKEKRDSLQGLKETPPPEESKTQKYVRIAFACIGIAFFAIVIVMAAWRKFGS
jgi:hypothetical protein